MNVRIKTALIIVVSLIVLTTLLAFVSSSVILKSFALYEEQETRKDIERVLMALGDDIEGLNRFARDWGSWDATYSYIENPDEAYIEKNMGSDLGIGDGGDYFADINVQLFMFVHRDGPMVFGRSYDQDKEEVAEVPKGLQDILTSDSLLLQHRDESRCISGVLVIPTGIVLLSSHPILTSDSEGPYRGSVLVGRYLSDDHIAEIADITNLSLSVERVDIPTSVSDMQQARDVLVGQSDGADTTMIQSLGRETIAGYALVYDIFNQPAIMIRVERPRDIYQQGLASVYYLIGALIVGVLVVGGIMMVMLQTAVVSPLIRIGKQVRSISRSNDLTTRVTANGSSELTELAHDINGMIHSLAQAQQALHESEVRSHKARMAAEEANRMKSKFLANMSHELRTPLNSIINFTRIVASGMRGDVNQEQVDYLNRVRANGEHLLGLINDILDLSKIEAGRMELYKQPCQLQDLVTSTLSTIIGLTKGKSVELHHDIEPDLPEVQADRTRVRQILLNLLSNAAKFTEQGSITARVMRDGDFLMVRVADTGRGIPPEKLETIFEEFRQADEGSDRSYEGTGLGLAICKRLVEMHGGRIWAESTPGLGSTFYFTLPIDGQIRACALPHTVPDVLDKQGTPVLVIDNDPAVVEIITTYLEHDGYAVYGVTDSRLALDSVLKVQPSVIILDILMPYKDGWTVLAELKANPDVQAIPVVLYTMIEEQRRGLHLGANAYLLKPIDEDQLRVTIARQVGNQATILVIDDDPDVRDILLNQLSQPGGYSVVTAPGGREGLEYIARTPPDLIILDLMMPEVDGFAVLHELDIGPETRSIPVVVLTAKDLTHEEHTYLNQRVGRLINKQEDCHEDVLKYVRTAVRQSQLEHTVHNGNGLDV